MKSWKYQIFTMWSHNIFKEFASNRGRNGRVVRVLLRFKMEVPLKKSSKFELRSTIRFLTAKKCSGAEIFG